MHCPCSSSNPNTSIPILHIEELTKRYYNVKSSRGHTHRKKYYDVDWRFYVAHKYGQYVLCGTRCPMYDLHNDKWPVVSASFASTREVFDFISLMIGENKINVTLFVSSSRADSESGYTFTHSDLAFSHPTNERFRALDSDREKRCSELVGYDRFRLSPRSGCGSSESKVVRLLNMMSALNSGNMVPFTVSPHPSLRKWNKRQERKQQQQQQQQRQQRQQRHQEEQEQWRQEEQEQEQAEHCNEYNSHNNQSTIVAANPAHAGDDDATQYDDYYDYIINDHQLHSDR